MDGDQSISTLLADKTETPLMNAISEENQQMILVEEKNQLTKEVQERKEMLRKLKMVQLYRKKVRIAFYFCKGCGYS